MHNLSRKVIVPIDGGDSTAPLSPPPPTRTFTPSPPQGIDSEVGGNASWLLCRTGVRGISIPVTNTSVNPARSTAVAVFVGDWAISQLWLFWVAPIIGAVAGALAYRFIGSEGS